MTDDIRDDLAYVKALAEEGRDTPLVNGLIYVIWGGLIGTTALVVYADAMGWVSLGSAGGVWPWVTAIAAGWGLSMFLGRKAGAKPGASTLGNRTAMSVWFAVGVFITAFWLTLMVVHDDFTALGVPPGFLFGLMFPLSFGLFGVAFYATATAARAPWLRIIAFSSWGFSIATLVLMTSKYNLLVAAVGVFACAVAPGLILMRNEPSETV